MSFKKNVKEKKQMKINKKPKEKKVKRKSRVAKQKNKLKMKHIIFAGLLIAAITLGAFLIDRNNSEVSAEQVIEKKNISITKGKDGKFITFTGKDITDLDMATLLDYYHKEDGDVKRIFWVNKTTPDYPVTYDSNLFSSAKYTNKNKIEHTAYLTIKNIDAKDIANIHYNLSGKQSATKNNVLTVKGRLSGEQNDDSVLAEIKNISNLIDQMNPDKKYKTKRIRMTFNDNQYLFDEKLPDSLLKFTYFQVD